jgi:ABC-type sugar transport system permease subunit
MGQTFSRKQLTPDEVNQLRTARTEYQDTLNSLQTNVQTDIQNKALTPESGQIILTEIQKAFTWLQKNPNATLIEVYANHDATTAEIKRVMAVDKPKKEFQNQILALPVIADEAFGKNLLTSQQVESLKQLSVGEAAWLKKNGSTASTVEFQQENIKVNTNIQKILKKADLVQFVTEKLNATKNAQPSILQSELVTREQKAKEARNATIHIEDGVNTIKNTALTTFFSFLLITICILGGSLAANQAIGRSRPYRILYFLYGAIPVFMPIVILYTVFSRLRYGPIPYYAILPLTIEPATTRIGRILNFPFYWIPDDTSRTLTKAFVESVEKIT